jgi:excisionase family DNA binding protein
LGRRTIDRLRKEKKVVSERENERSAFTVGEIAARTGLGRTYLYDEMRDGRLKYKMAGKRRIITPDQERAWLEAMPEGGNTE